MKFYQILSGKQAKHSLQYGFFKADNDTDILRMTCFSILYGNVSPREISYFNYEWDNITMGFEISQIREKYKIDSEVKDVLAWLMENENIVEISEEKFQKLLSDNHHHIACRNFLRYNTDYCVRTMANFHKENPNKIAQWCTPEYLIKYPNYLKEVKTIKYWNSSLNELLQQWQFFNMPLDIPQ